MDASGLHLTSNTHRPPIVQFAAAQCTLLGSYVGDRGPDGGVDCAGDHAVAFQGLQRAGQPLLVDAADWQGMTQTPAGAFQHDGRDDHRTATEDGSCRCRLRFRDGEAIPGQDQPHPRWRHLRGGRRGRYVPLGPATPGRDGIGHQPAANRTARWLAAASKTRSDDQRSGHAPQGPQIENP